MDGSTNNPLDIGIFDTSDVISIIISTIGMYMTFKKLGVNKLFSLVPVYRDYKFAQSVDREDEGKIYCICNLMVQGIAIFRTFFIRYFTEFPQLDIFVMFALIILSAIFFIYSARVFFGLCEIFNMKKRWVILAMIAPGLELLYFGFSKKITPRYIEPEDTDDKEAAALSGYLAKETNEGLSVNIKSRTVKNHFKTKTLLRDIHLNIEPGNMVLLLGGSGAGKTTFLNAVTGYEAADAKILLNGDDVYTRFDKMKYNIGFVPQQDLIRYNDTVYRTLADAAALRLPSDMPRKEKKERIEKVLDIFGLRPVKDNIVGKQSGGQKKRISIATEFISDPSLFILDEPDSGLDGILARDLMTRLHEISRDGKIVIVITHTPDRVIDLFDKVIVLGKDADRTGRLVFYGSIDEAKEFFNKDKMEDIVKMINREDEGGEGKSDELIEKFGEVRNGEI
ncbi:MAG: ABC transporter ATP-binding protein [Lachnospiraceae bacterium]|nr:ABC transporter ATP-binding protein [Lachnospiraceae bacterium]